MSSKKNSEAQRAPNFSASDIEILIQLVKNYQLILECKKSDAVTWREKNQAWESIAKEMEEFAGTSRTPKTLRDKYKNLKTESKKKFADEKCQTFKTGGGKFTPVEITSTDMQLKELSGMGMTGLTNRVDNDRYENIYIEIEGEGETSITEDNLTQCSTDEPETSACTQISDEIKEDHTHQESMPGPSWKVWNPTMLKAPKASALTTDVRKDNSGLKTPKRMRKTVLTEDCRFKINTLSEAKLELTNLQIQCLKDDQKRKEQEHDIIMSKLREEKQHQKELNSLIIEQQKLELEILKKN